jgi:chorismate mutase
VTRAATTHEIALCRTSAVDTPRSALYTRRLAMRAIRGAISVDANTAEAIQSAVGELVQAICALNELDPADIVSAIFTLTPDLNADFPARAARLQGWSQVPMVCAQEIPVPGAPQRICRLLVHVRGAANRVKHVYLKDARALRPDLGEREST